MIKEIKDRIELNISNIRHVCNHYEFTRRSPAPAGCEIVYLLEKIEDLQEQINELKPKAKKNK